MDGVVCGHIHKPQLSRRDGFVYCNDGDWVEHCSALVERLDGTLSLVHWTEQQYSLVETGCGQPSEDSHHQLNKRAAWKL